MDNFSYKPTWIKADLVAASLPVPQPDKQLKKIVNKRGRGPTRYLTEQALS